MTQLLLPAPAPVLLLPAWASPEPVQHSAPRFALSDVEAALLLVALMHHNAGYNTVTVGEGVTWFPVQKDTRTDADNLVLYGYFTKHPNKRKKMWYALTEDGLIRAQREQEAAEAQEVDHPAPDTRQDRLHWERRHNLEALTREMGHQGFVLYNEAGRGITYGEQAFYNVFSREIVLYRCSLGSAVWRQRQDGYFKPDPAFQVAIADVVEIPF